MSVKIRSFEEEDLAAFVKLLNEARLGSFEYMPLTEEEVRRRMGHGKSQVLIAEDADRVVGSVTYSDGYWGEEIRWVDV